MNGHLAFGKKLLNNYKLGNHIACDSYDEYGHKTSIVSHVNLTGDNY